LQRDHAGDDTLDDAEGAADVRREDGERVALELVDDAEETDGSQRVEPELVLAERLAERRRRVTGFAGDTERAPGTVTQCLARLLDFVDERFGLMNRGEMVRRLGHQWVPGSSNWTDHAPSPTRRPAASSRTTVTSWNWRLRSLPMSLATCRSAID